MLLEKFAYYLIIYFTLGEYVIFCRIFGHGDQFQVQRISQGRLFVKTKNDAEMYACMHQLLYPPRESAKRGKTRFDAWVVCDMEYQTESSRSVILLRRFAPSYGSLP